MRKQHFAEFPVDQTIILIGGEADVFQGKALHLRAVFILAFQRHKRSLRRGNRMAEAFGKTVTVAGRSRQRIGQAACADSSRAAADRSFLRHDAADASVFAADGFCLRAKETYTEAAAFLQQQLGHVVCIVADRKNAVTALDFERQTAIFKPGHHISGRKAVHRAVQEAPVPRHIGQYGFDVAVIGQIAATLAGDSQLPAQLLIGIKHRHSEAALGGRRGKHQPGCPAADHD